HIRRVPAQLTNLRAIPRPDALGANGPCNGGPLRDVEIAADRDHCAVGLRPQRQLRRERALGGVIKGKSRGLEPCKRSPSRGLPRCIRSRVAEFYVTIGTSGLAPLRQRHIELHPEGRRKYVFEAEAPFGEKPPVVAEVYGGGGSHFADGNARSHVA